MRLASAKAWLHRGTFVLLFGAAFALMVLGKADTPLIERARVSVIDALSPIMEGLAKPIASVRQLYDNARDFWSLREQNASLKADQERLLEWQTVARQLQAENDALRAMLRLVPEPSATFVTARVVADNGGAFVRTVLVTAGLRDGVRKGSVAMTGEGVVGRVAEVGEHSARVLLLSDISSRIPVTIERTRDQAILAGDNSDNPRLLYLPHGSALTPGDRIVTSTAGGAFPGGLPIGQVVAIQDGVPIVQLFVAWDRLEYLRLVDYKLPGVLQSGAGKLQ
ncbi:MAG TPA: rod shape-determining protein MreC [Dongiaceae bacterium]